MEMFYTVTKESEDNTTWSLAAHEPYCFSWHSDISMQVLKALKFQKRSAELNFQKPNGTEIGKKWFLSVFQ